jgi:hypothetical protein
VIANVTPEKKSEYNAFELVSTEKPIKTNRENLPWFTLSSGKGSSEKKDS